MKIAVVDDDNTQLEYLKKLVTEWSAKAEHSVIFDVFFSSEEFLFKNEDRLDYDIIILDIQMEKMSGMELARKIRQKDKLVRIVFLTGIKDYVFEGYEVNAYRYIMKPYKDADIISVLDEYEENKENQPVYLLEYYGELKKIYVHDIIYITVDNHYLNMETTQSNYQWKETLGNIREKLGEGFVLINRSTLVNLRHVESINKTDCIMSDGKKLSISRNSYKALNVAFIKYYC